MTGANQKIHACSLVEQATPPPDLNLAHGLKYQILIGQ